MRIKETNPTISCD